MRSGRTGESSPIAWICRRTDDVGDDRGPGPLRRGRLERENVEVVRGRVPVERRERPRRSGTVGGGRSRRTQIIQRSPRDGTARRHARGRSRSRRRPTAAIADVCDAAGSRLVLCPHAKARSTSWVCTSCVAASGASAHRRTQEEARDRGTGASTLVPRWLNHTAVNVVAMPARAGSPVVRPRPRSQFALRRSARPAPGHPEPGLTAHHDRRCTKAPPRRDRAAGPATAPVGRLMKVQGCRTTPRLVVDVAVPADVAARHRPTDGAFAGRRRVQLSAQVSAVVLVRPNRRATRKSSDRPGKVGRPADRSCRCADREREHERPPRSG